MPPLIYGRHPLPRDLKNMTTKLKHGPDGDELKLWLEKVAQLLDSVQPDPEHWLLLKQLMVKLLQMTDQEEARVIFRSIFDPMRVRVWSKIHLKVDPDSFATNLFTKLFDVSNPSSRDLIVVYANVASDLKVKLKRIKTDNESQLSLSKSHKYHHPNLNKPFKSNQTNATLNKPNQLRTNQIKPNKRSLSSQNLLHSIGGQ